MATSFSIRSKILLLACGSAAVALGLACAGFAVNGVRTLREAKLRQLSDQVKMVAFHAAPILTLHSKEAGERAMASLRSDPTVEAACVVNLNHEILVQHGQHYDNATVNSILAAGSRFLDAGHVEVVQPVMVGSVKLGHIIAYSNTKDMEAQLMDFARIAVYVLATAMLVAVLLAVRLQRGISEPILALTRATQRIAISDDYSIRVNVSAQGELLTLQSAFNRMLDQIQRSDRALQLAHAKLEDRVAARTEELSLEIARHKQTQADLMRAKEVAESANRAKSEFLANVSHEIRTPLNGIIGFTDLMLNRTATIGHEEQREYLTTIRRSGLHLADLINDVLDLSKIEAGRLETEQIAFSPHDVIADVVSEMRLRVEEKGLAIRYEWSSAMPDKIVSDPARLRQLLVNLIGNAVKFTERGEIRVTAGMTPTFQPRLQLVVADTGIGIPAEKLESIFEPFTQADTSVTRRFGGTGLGLAISRKIATALGGSLEVSSQVGAGSTFAVTLDPGPLLNVRFLTDPPPEPCPSVRAAPTTQMLPPVHILVADDGDTNRKLVALILERAGATVSMVENGQQVLDAVAKSSFDSILLDMQMPVMDGYSAARELRRRGLSTPIVALTAHAMKGDEEKCKAAGCSEYLSKPIDADRLVAKLASLFTGTSPRSESRLISNLPMDDAEFREIVAEFLARTRDRVTAMFEARDQRDADELRRLAHWLKGAGGTAGFPQLTEPAKALECAAREACWVDVAAWLDVIKHIVDRIDIPVLAAAVPSDLQAVT